MLKFAITLATTVQILIQMSALLCISNRESTFFGDTHVLRSSRMRSSVLKSSLP